MPLLSELGTATRQRRLDIGLSQQRLAEMAGLSRATINELDTGRLKDLSAHRAERLANALGFAVGLVGTRRPEGKGAFEAAARVASVPYASELPAPVLEASLREGTIAPGYIPHLRGLLQEAPVALLAGVAEELQAVHGVPTSQAWKNMQALAAVLKCDRPLWQGPST